MTGRKSVIDVRVRHLPDSLSRQRLLRRLRSAAADPGVVGVVLHLEQPPGSWAACHDLRSGISRLREAGTPVYAVLEQPGNALLWLASACERVFMVPTGQALLVGIGAELTFFGRTLERVGVAPDFEAAGEYKSFGEAYTRSFASEANQEAMAGLVEDLHQQLIEGVAEGRGLDVERVQELTASAPLSPVEAVEAGLVDQLAYDDELGDWLEETHGKESCRIEFDGWAKRAAALEWIDQWARDGSVVHVLHLDGPIVMEDSGHGENIRARRVVELINKLRKDDAVKAVVLHVNSPGGQALASDLLWREVELLQKKKPVVAAFEDVAASGGFYLAAPAAEIIARPTTLTGSIGVFGGKLVMGEGMRKLGVTTQPVLAAPNANLYTAARPFTDDQRIRFRESLQRFYDGFVERVATGRRTAPALIEPHCRGRVWTGRMARERGLVDGHGDLFDAVDRAAKLAELRPGCFRQRDTSALPSRSMLTNMLQKAAKDVVPGASMSRAVAVLDTAMSRWLTPSLEVVLQSQGEVLAMLPVDVRMK